MQRVNDKDNVYFIYLGFKYGSQKKEKTFPFTEEALVDIFEDDFEAYEKASEILGEHLGKLKKTQDLAMKGMS